MNKNIKALTRRRELIGAQGVFVSMTGNFALAMFAAGMAQQGAIFQQAEIHKAKMSALAEPWAYDFSNGWAKIYGEV